MKRNIDILGEQYTIITDNKLINKDGYCDKTVQKIEVCKSLYKKSKPGQIENVKWQADRVMRHECIHALFFESGNEYNIGRLHTEEVVDWISFMYPKMKKIFQELMIEGD